VGLVSKNVKLCWGYGSGVIDCFLKMFGSAGAGGK